MNTTQMIECANIKSQAYQGLNTRSTDNAQWENVVNLDLREGDRISVANRQRQRNKQCRLALLRRQSPHETTAPR